MVFKKKTNAKRKYTKRRHNMKKKYTNRKLKKYGGKCINPTNAVEIIKLKVYLQKMAGLSLVEANDIVDGMVNSKYIYDCDNILKTLRTAVSAGSSSDRQAIIFSTLNKINKQAEKSQAPESQAPESQAPKSQAPESQAQESISQKKVSNDGCPSYGREPVNCSTKKDYINQTLIFHPDKNPMCKEESTPKFQALQNNTTCQFD